jgi:plasmid stabilization system protein ParE
MKNAVFHRLAEQELADAIAYYEKQGLGLGVELLEEVRRAVFFLSRFPRVAPRVHGNIRRFNLPKFPYSLLYRPLDDGRIRILAAAHHKRMPYYWVARK